MRRIAPWTRVLIIFLLSLVIGGLLVWAASSCTGALALVLQSVGAVILTSGFFSWFGSYEARIEGAKVFADLFPYVEKVRQAGILDVTRWPIDLPLDTRNIDIVVIRAHTWFTMFIPKLERVLEKPGWQVRICALDPRSQAVPALAAKFEETQEKLKEKISATILTLIQEAEKMRRLGVSGKFLLAVHKSIPSYSYYRFDDTGFVAWYQFQLGRADVPLLQLGPGWLRDFFQSDFEGLLGQTETTMVYDSSRAVETNRTALRSLGIPDASIDAIFGSPSPGSAAEP